VNLEREIALELFVDWLLQQLVIRSASIIVDRQVRRPQICLMPLNKNLIRHRVNGILANIDVMLVDILVFLAGTCDSAILVNLDEAQQLPQRELKRSIELILSPLLQRGARVYLSVSGLDSKQHFEGMNSSSARTLKSFYLC